MTTQLLSQFAGPAVQVILIAVLFWVGFLFMRVDKKLNQLRRGTDGVRATIVELNKAVNKAKNALDGLKEGTAAQVEEISAKIEEAKKLSEGLTFLNSVKKNLNPKASTAYDPRGAEPKGLPPAEDEYMTKRSAARANVKSAYARRRPIRERNDYAYDDDNYYDLRQDDYNDYSRDDEILREGEKYAETRRKTRRERSFSAWNGLK